MSHVRWVPFLAFSAALISLLLLPLFFLQQLAMLRSAWLLSPLILPVASSVSVGLTWHPPNSSWINDLGSVINGTGIHGFIFNSSDLPSGVSYGSYNWCNMPHVRRQEYPVASREYKLQYVEVIHRHHKRTPYASNTFPTESYPWYCSNQGLFYYGQPLNPDGKPAAETFWNVSMGSVNPFKQPGFNGSCTFPQITREGLDDSWQHGKDLYGVYHDLLDFLPSKPGNKVTFRVTNNVITSQVVGMVINGMYGVTDAIAVQIQPSGVDSLEPSYPCSSASSLFGSYGSGSSSSAWLAHLKAAASLYATLDDISGVSPTDFGFHQSFDRYFDNLSARQCHAKPLPCKIGDSSKCVTQDMANWVYRLGQYEYSFIYRDAYQSLQACSASFGVWIAELAQNIRDNISGSSKVIYRHNVAHDSSVSRFLSILQLDVMVWPGMGSEVVLELYKKEKTSDSKRYIRILWGGQILTSSNPSLGKVDMLDADVLLAYFDGLVGARASDVVRLCSS